MDPLTVGLILGGGSLIGSGLSAWGQKSAAEAAADAQTRAAQLGIEEQRRAYADALPYLEPYSAAGQEGLNMLLAGIQSGQFTGPEIPEYQFQGSVEDYLDPSTDYQQRKIREQLEQSAAAGGQLSSGATLKALQQEAQDRAMMDYQNAFARRGQERAFDYQDFVNRFNISRQNVADRYNQIANLSQQGFGAGQSIANLRTGQASNVANLLQQQGQAQAVAAAAPGAFGANLAGGLTNALGQGLGAYQTQQMINPPAPQSAQIPAQTMVPPQPGNPQFGMGAAYGAGGYMPQGNLGG